MYSVSCIIESHSHKLSEEAFALLMTDKTLTKVRKVDEKYIDLVLRAEKSYFKNPKNFYLHAHVVASNFVMALNIASLGHFTWVHGTQLSPVYEMEHLGATVQDKQIVFLQKRKYPLEVIEISKKEVKNALILAGALLKEIDQNIRREYIKGIIHLGMMFGDMEFDKEAFSNFYRLFEYVSTHKILGKKKLKNELKELMSVIVASGMQKDVADDFKGLYKIRSEQVMHAQQYQEKISIDEVLKIKVYLDFVLHKYYRKLADEWLKEHRKQPLTTALSVTS